MFRFPDAERKGECAMIPKKATVPFFCSCFLPALSSLRSMVHTQVPHLCHSGRSHWLSGNTPKRSQTSSLPPAVSGHGFMTGEWTWPGRAAPEWERAPPWVKMNNLSTYSVYFGHFQVEGLTPSLLLRSSSLNGLSKLHEITPGRKCRA